MRDINKLAVAGWTAVLVASIGFWIAAGYIAWRWVS